MLQLTSYFAAKRLTAVYLNYNIVRKCVAYILLTNSKCKLKKKSPANAKGNAQQRFTVVL